MTTLTILPDDDVEVFHDGIRFYGIVVGCGGAYVHVLTVGGTVTCVKPSAVVSVRRFVGPS